MSCDVSANRDAPLHSAGSQEATVEMIRKIVRAAVDDCHCVFVHEPFRGLGADNRACAIQAS